MKIESVKLRGFIGVKKGMGLDDLSLDLSGLDGLIALAGPNGNGKSTLLENLQPYRTLASRKRAMQHHVFLRDSEKRLSFRWNGDLYETQIKIDADNGKSEGYIWRNGTPEIRGKVREYDEYISALLGSDTLFFSSVFCAQNSDKLSDMTTGQLKSLFSEFLRLDRYTAWEATAKQVITLLSTLKDTEERQAQHFEKLMEGAILCKEDIRAARSEKVVWETSLSKLRETLAGVEAQHMDAVEKSVKNEGFQQKLTDLEIRKGQSMQIRIDAEIKNGTTVLDLNGKILKIVDEAKAIKTILTDKEKILAAVSEEKALRLMIESATNDGMETKAQADALQAQVNESTLTLNQLRADLKSLSQDPEIKLLEAGIAALREQVKTLDLKDPACQSTTCSFIVSALEAEKRIPEKEAELERKSTSNLVASHKLQKEIGVIDVDLQADQKALAVLNETLDTLRGAVKKNKTRLAEVAALAQKATGLEVARSKLETLTARMAELEADKTRIESEWKARDESRCKEIDRLTREIIEVKAAIDDNAETAVKEMAEMARKTKENIRTTEKQVSDAQAKIQTLESQLKAMDDAGKSLQQTRAKRDRIISEAGQWAYLRDACGAKGLRALEIDSVAPTISAYANDLLTGTFGPLFSVRFRTQDDSGREVLDILVIRDDGSEVLLDDLSGGEKVWILKALRLSMMLVSKEKSGRGYGTLFADEEDGPLSSENAVHFIALYRALLKAANMDTCFYISHRPEAIGMADYVMEFGKGGIVIS